MKYLDLVHKMGIQYVPFFIQGIMILDVESF